MQTPPRYAEAAWTQEEITWGLWNVPEADVGALGDVAGKDVVELGCGTGYLSAWLARRGARVVGVDVTAAQLETARALQDRHGPAFPLLEADAEHVPLPDAGFDLVVSEYGASVRCDPRRWIPEAARLLRPGGLLVFLRNGTLAVLTWDAEGNVGTALRRDYFGLGRKESSDDGTVDFELGWGDWIRLLRANDLEIENLVELRAPEGPELPEAEWGRRWPFEEIWKARKER
jgi:SAM-dependent methyltransferase